jgi:peptidoglycan/LPS O-acetylase OafA/YrhL
MTSQLSNHTNKPRVKILDSFRGLAAFAVVFAHISAGIFYSKFVWYTPLYLVTAAREAVIFFFILSGYVLTYQYANAPDYNYRSFLTQRFIRIYIPYICAILFCIPFFLTCNPNNVSNGLWVSGIWKSRLNINDVLGHIFLVGNFDTDKLDPVIWSLVHEMRIALIFPFILYVIRFNINKAIVLALLISLLASLLHQITWLDVLLNSYIETMAYFYMFVLGAIIAKHQDLLSEVYHKLSKFSKRTFVLVSFLIYSCSHVIYRFVIHSRLPHAVIDYIYHYLVDFCIVMGACGLIISAVAIRDQKNIFTKKCLLFFGKISYSLYLVHVTVWAFIYYQFRGSIPLVPLACIGLLMSLVIASLFNKYLEKPAMNAGRKLLVT